MTGAPQPGKVTPEASLPRYHLEIVESAILACFEPAPLAFCYEDEFQRAGRAIARARDGKLARFSKPVNRNAFLLACGAYTEARPLEHLIVGYGYRHGSTTKIKALHRTTGDAQSVPLPREIAHAMWDFYERDERNELLLFHNHPYNSLNELLDNLPLPSGQDRDFLQVRGLQPTQVLRRLLGGGRVLFYLGENGYVKEFKLPRVLPVLEQLGRRSTPA